MKCAWLSGLVPAIRHRHVRDEGRVWPSDCEFDSYR